MKKETLKGKKLKCILIQITAVKKKRSEQNVFLTAKVEWSSTQIWQTVTHSQQQINIHIKKLVVFYF